MIVDMPSVQQFVYVVVGYDRYVMVYRIVITFVNVDIDFWVLSNIMVYPPSIVHVVVVVVSVVIVVSVVVVAWILVTMMMMGRYYSSMFLS